MKYQLKKDGKNLDFLAEKIGSQIWVNFKGKTHVIQAGSSGTRRGQKGGKSNQDAILSPMPGKVTKIVAKAGSELKAGDVAVVMEAMKMEYTLKADHDTKVAKVLVSEGAQVTLGQVLVEFEKA